MLMSWETSVCNTRRIDSGVQRVECSNGCKCDVPEVCMMLQPHEDVEVTVCDTQPKDKVKGLPPYLTRGRVYLVHDNVSCVSAGGLLFQLPCTLPLHAQVYVKVSSQRLGQRTTRAQKKRRAV